MAHIRRRGPGRYQVRYRRPDGRDTSRTFTKKADAQRFLHQIEIDKARGEYTDPRQGRLTFREWWSEVEAGRVHLRSSTRARDASYSEAMILPTFGKLQLIRITPEVVRQWVSDLSGRYAPATVRKAYQLLSHALELAVVDNRIPRSPCRGIRLPTVEASEKRFLTTTEVDALSDAIHPAYRGMVLLGAYGGLRFGEVAGVRVRDLDLLRGAVTVRNTLSEVRGEVSLGPPKTKASIRTVMLPRSVSEELAHHMALFPPGDDELVFNSPMGGPIRRTNWRRRIWAPAVAASVGGELRFHDLRHSHVAMLIGQGEHAKVIADRLGHTSVRTVLDVYGHLFEGLDEAAAERLNAIIAGNREAFARPETDAAVIPFPSE